MSAGSLAAVPGAQLGYSGAIALLRVILAGTLPTHRRRGAVIAVLGGYAGIVVPLVLLLLAPARLWGSTLGLAALCLVIPTVLLWRMRRVGSIRIPMAQKHTEAPAPRAAPVLGLLLLSGLLLWRPRALENGSRVIAGASIVLAASLLLRATGESLPVIAAAAFISGAAVGATTSALLSSALESAPNGRKGGFIGAYSAVGALGQMIGPLLGRGVITLTNQILPDAGYRPLFWVLAILPAAWAVWLWVNGRVRRRIPASVA